MKLFPYITKAAGDPQSMATDWSPVQEFLNGDDNMTNHSLLSDYSRIGSPYRNVGLVYSCVNKIAGPIAQLPFQILDSNDNVLNDRDPFVRLFRTPYPNVNRFALWEGIIKNLELNGKAHLVITEFIGGRPAMMLPVDSSKMRVVKDSQGQADHWIYNNRKRYEPNQVIFFRYWHPSDIWDGMAPLTAARMDLTEMWYANTYNIQFFKDGALLKGFFKSSGPRRPDPGKEKEMEMAMKSRMRGVRDAHKIPVFNNAEYVPIGIPQKDMDYVNLLGNSRDNIFMIFGTPKAVFGFTDTTFNNMTEAKKFLWTNTLLPKIALLEEVLLNQFFARFAPTLHANFDHSEVPELQVDIEGLSKAAQVYWNMGVPFQAINERLNLGFPADLQMEAPAALPLPAPPGKAELPEPRLVGEGRVITEADVPKLVAEYRRQKRIEYEKSLTYDKEIRRMEYKRVLSTMLRQEEPMIRSVKNFWNERYQEMKAFVDEKVQKSAEKSISNEAAQVIISYLHDAEWGIGLADVLAPEIKRSFSIGAKRSYWGLGVRFREPVESAITFAAKRGVKIQRSADVVQQALIDSIKASDTIDDFAKSLPKVFDVGKNRAKLIARTETTNAYNGGRLQGMKDVGVKKKQWLNAGDGNVRDSHQIEEVVNVDEMFTLGDGTRVMHPGDGPPEDACNCRCSIISVLE